MENVVYLVDTNVLLNNPSFLKDNNAVIPAIVLRELENLEKKRSNPSLLYDIREAKRAIMEAEENETVNFFLGDIDEESIVNEFNLDGEYGDNELLYVAKILSEDSEYKIVVYTGDILLKLKCELFGIDVEFDDNNYGDLDYNGVEIFEYDSENEEHQAILSAIYSNNDENPLNLLENQYLIVKENGKILQILRYFDGKYANIKYNSVKNEYITLDPLNTMQKIAFDLMQRDDVKIKSVMGEIGTGKDIVIFSHALDKLSSGDIDKIVWIGNAVQAKGTKEIGFLPGNREEKLYENYAVLSDVLGGEYILDDMIVKEKIVIEHVGGLRSRTFNNAYIIVGEAQNFTIEQLKLILGRVGYNSYIAFNGDMKQSDINNSGLNQFIDALKGQDLFGCIELDDVVRSEVAKLSTLI